jgi:hypothetical protein
MTIRTVLNPYGGIPPIVDARIGTAYAVVEICVLNLETITEVANSMPQIQVVYNNMNAIVQINGNTANVNLVAANIQDINSVAADIESVNTVAANAEDIATIVANLQDINTVAVNIQDINTVAINADDISIVAPRFETELTSRAQSIAGAIGATVTLPWPVGVTLADVLASSVLIKGTNNWLYHPGSTTFVATGKPAGLEVVVQTGATAVVGGTILWHITHTP